METAKLMNHPGAQNGQSNSNAKADVVKVSAQSRSTAVAGAIAGIIRERGHVEVQAIGAGAVNQALKAAAIARSYLLQEGKDIHLLPAFSNVVIDGVERTAVRLTIERRNA